MQRREFIGLIGGAAAWPYCAEAQVSRKVWRIGHVLVGAPSVLGHFADAFEQHMLEYFPDRSFTVARRFTEPKSVDEAVRDLVPDIDVLVIWTTVGGVAAKKYATMIPVVFLGVGAPVDIGLVQSLNHPGGNMTGLTFEAASETYAKRLQILTEIVPNLERLLSFGPLATPTSPLQWSLSYERQQC